MGRASKSPWVIHYDASSCNGCDIEVLATLCPGYDAERFGIINTGNPKHADIFLVTGSVNERNIHVIKEIYDQMLEPKVVVACVICACSGGVFREFYNVIGGVDKAIPVDVYAPGCAVRPEAIIDAVVQGIAVLDEKSKAFKAGTLPIKPGNDWLTDEEYEAQKERELREEDGTEAFEKEYEKKKAKKSSSKEVK